jgi:HlyD family secretion protein
VIRIDPAVNAGMVQVDVKLSGKLPNEARPDLTVNGSIEISNIDDALFVKRPAFDSRHSKTGLYRLTADAQFVQK